MRQGRDDTSGTATGSGFHPARVTSSGIPARLILSRIIAKESEGGRVLTFLDTLKALTLQEFLDYKKTPTLGPVGLCLEGPLVVLWGWQILMSEVPL